jgi:hypothetical protein
MTACKGPSLEMGKVYRYARNHIDRSPKLDGLANFRYITRLDDGPVVQCEAGIDPIGAIKAPEGKRIPAICLRGSPHRVGSEETPWEDFFDEDNGFIRYFGDNKPGKGPPEMRAGNRQMLDEHLFHTSEVAAQRIKAVPILAFQAVKIGARIKGNLKFCGLCLIDKVERVTQFDSRKRSYFTNYVYSLCVLSLVAEDENLFWNWINARRDKNKDLNQCLLLAPKAWQEWVKHGSRKRSYYQRSVIKQLIVHKSTRQLEESTKEMRVLKAVLKYYDKNKKHAFEYLASQIVARIFQKQNARYVHGWVTNKSDDGGIDFVGRVDFEGGLTPLKVIVIGQAKCEKIKTPTNGVHIARTVARLKRGWIGAYVTTSFFSRPVQEEILEDSYPLLLVDGKAIAEQILYWHSQSGYPKDDFDSFFRSLEADNRIERKRPEDILYFSSGTESVC